MACYYAPNNKESNLYNSVNEALGENIAEEHFLYVRTSEFKEQFGNWEAVSYADLSGIDFDKVIAEDPNLSNVVDENAEPIPVYLEKRGKGYWFYSSTPIKDTKPVYLFSRETTEVGNFSPASISSLIDRRAKIVKTDTGYLVLDKSLVIEPKINNRVSEQELVTLLEEIKKRSGVDYVIDYSIPFAATVKDNKIFVNPEKADSSSPIHEYAHIIIHTQKKANPGLYNNLIKEAKSFREYHNIVAAIKDNELYKDNFEEEALVRLLTKMSADNSMQNKYKPLWQKFIEAIKQFLSSLFGITDVSSLPENITLQQLVDLTLNQRVKGLVEVEEQYFQDETQPTIDERLFSIQAAFRDVYFVEDKIEISPNRYEIDPYSNMFKRTHYYMKGDRRVDKSVTELIKEEEYFDYEKYINQYYRTVVSDLANPFKTKNEGKTLKDGVNDEGIFLNDSLLDFLNNPLDPNNPKITWDAYVSHITNNYTDQMIEQGRVVDKGGYLEANFNRLFYIFRKWARHRESGTVLHQVLEAIMSEPEDRIQKPLIDRIYRRIQDIKSQADLTDEDKSILLIAEAAEKIKTHVESKGGKILAEQVLFTDKVREYGGDQITLATKPDVIAVYPDGAAEIYDLKTMTNRAEDVRPSESKGYKRNKQFNNAVQLLIHARILEDNPRILIDKVVGMYTIPVYVEDTYDRNALSDGTAPYGRSQHLPKTAELTKFSKDNAALPDEKIEAGLDFLMNMEAFNENNGLFSRAKDWVNRRLNFRSDVVITEEEQIERERIIDEDYRADKFDSELYDMIIKIKAYAENALVKDNLKQKELAKLRANLESMEDLLKVFEFANYAYKMIVEGGYIKDEKGNLDFILSLQERIEGIRSRFETKTYDKYDEGENLRLAIVDIDTLRRELRSYSIIDDLLKVLNDAPSNQLENIKNHKSYTKLKEAQDVKQQMFRILDNLGMRLVAKSLYNYRIDTLNKDIANYFDAVIKRKQDKLDVILDNVNKGITSKETVEETIKSLSSQIKKLYEDKTKQTLTEGSILEELYSLDSDIQAITKAMISATTVNNKIIGLSSALVHDKFQETDREVLRGQVKIQQILDKHGKQLVKLNPKKYSLNNLSGITNELIQKIEVYRPSTTGKPELTTMWSLIAPYDLSYLNHQDKLYSQLTSMVTGEGIVLDDNLNPIIENDKPKIATFSDIRNKREEIRKWQHNNLQRKYKDNYYKYRDLLYGENLGKTESEQRKEARRILLERLADISDQIAQIIENDEEHTAIEAESVSAARRKILTNEERWQLDQLYYRKRELASMYDIDGNRKTGIELEIAELYDEHNKLFSSVHDFITDTEDYEDNRRRITEVLKLRYGNSTVNIDGIEKPEWELQLNLWEMNNQDVVTTDAFNNKVRRLFLHRKVLKFLDKLYNQKGVAKTDVDDLRRTILPIFINDNDTEVIEDVDKIIAALEIEGASELWSETSGDHEELNNLIRPYYTNSGYDVRIIKESKDLIKRIKQIEEESNTETIQDPGLLEQYRDINAQLFGIEGEGGIAAYVEIPEYFDELMKAKALVGTEDNDGNEIVSIEQTEWWKNNHVTIKYKKKSITRPLRIWTKLQPIALKQRLKRGKSLSAKYNIERALEVDKIVKRYKNRSFSDYNIENEVGYQEAIENLETDSIFDTPWFADVVHKKLIKTSWFKQAHLTSGNSFIVDEDNNYIVSDTYKTLLKEDEKGNIVGDADSHFIAKPNRLYTRALPKKEHLRSEEELKDIYDNKGRLKPIKSLWENKRYEELMSRTDPEGVLLQNIYKQLSNIYFEDQDVIPDKKNRLGYLLPGERKSTLDMVFDESGNFSFKGLKKAIKEELKTSFVTVSDDVEDIPSEGNVPTTEFDFKPLRTLIPMTTSPDEVETNIFRTFLIHKAKAHRYRAKYDMLPEIRTLMDVLKNRDADPNRGKKVKDIRGRAIIDKTYRLLTGKSIDDTDLKSLTVAGETWQYKMLHDFFEMQIFAERNLPVEIRKITSSLASNKVGNNKWLAQRMATIQDKVHSKYGNRAMTVRVDKVFDTMRGLASMSQVGGFYSINTIIAIPAFMKGVANWMNAKHQQWMEAQAGKFYDLEDIKFAEKHFFYPNNGTPTFAQKLTDFGKLTNITLAGQLEDYFSPIQGDNFTDNLGRKIVGADAALIVKSMMSRDIMFFFQHTGEYQAAMTLLYAMMHSHKVFKGKVYSRDQWLQKTEEEKGSSLTLTEKTEALLQFNQIKKSLIDIMSIGPDGTLTVEQGVEFGDRLDISKSERYSELTEKVNNKTITEAEELEYKTMIEQINASKKATNEFTRKLHELSRDLNGNYSKFSTPTAKRHFLVRLLFQYKDYLAPMLIKRFGPQGINYHLGTPRYGFHRHFFKLLFTSFKDTRSEIGSIIANKFRKVQKHNERLGDLEIENIKRALHEQLIVLGIVLSILFLAPGEDEDKDEISYFRWMLLYELAKMRQEIGSMTPSIVYPKSIFKENWKILQSPISLYRYMTDVIDFLTMLGFDDPYSIVTTGEWAKYKRDVGKSIDAGDSKTYHKLMRLLGTGGSFDPEQMYNNLNRK